MFQPKHIISLILLCGLFASCSSKVDENVLAKIDDLEVTEAHFVSAFKNYYYRTGQALQPSPQTKANVLDAEFSTYVLAAHAFKSGMADTWRSQKQLGMIQRKVMAEEYLKREVLDNIGVNEDDLQTLFLRFNTKVRASHLYAPDLESANKLYERLQNGEDFEKLAKEVFQNAYLANNGGDVGEFTVDEMDIAFENAAFSLQVGEISTPVKTKQGYSIIKLTDRYTTPIITEFQYNSTKHQFVGLAKQRKDELATRVHLERTVQSLNINEALIEEIWEAFSQSQHSTPLIAENYQLHIPLPIPDEAIIAAKGNYTFTVRDLKQEGAYTPDDILDRINTAHRFSEFIKGLAYRSYILDDFSRKYDASQPEIAGSINHTFYNFLAAEVIEKLKAEMEFTEEELFQEFAEFRDFYDFPMMMNLARIVVDSREKGKEVVKKLQSGMPWKQALRQYSIEKQDLLVDGELGLQPLTNLGSHAFQVKDLQEGEIAGPFDYQTGKLMVYKVLEIQPGRSATFAEVRDLVDEVLRQKRLPAYQKEFIEQVKKEHHAVLNYEKLNSITITL